MNISTKSLSGLHVSRENMKQQLNSKQPLSLKSGNSQSLRPKRHALGDITNRSFTNSRKNNKHEKNNKKDTINMSFTTTKPKHMFEIPKDTFGNIEEPEFIPQAPPLQPFEPELDLSDLDIDMEMEKELEHVNNKLHQEAGKSTHTMPGFLNGILDDDDLDMDMGLYRTKPLISVDQDPEDSLLVTNLSGSGFDNAAFLSTDDIDELEIM